MAEREDGEVSDDGESVQLELLGILDDTPTKKRKHEGDDERDAKKSKTGHVPLKKRTLENYEEGKEISAGDLHSDSESVSFSEEEDSLSEYDEITMYKDDEDRRQLELLPQMERESILFDRRERLARRRTLAKLSDKKGRKQQSRTRTAATRRKRDKDQKHKRAALAEMALKRNQSKSRPAPELRNSPPEPQEDKSNDRDRDRSWDRSYERSDRQYERQYDRQYDRQYERRISMNSDASDEYNDNADSQGGTTLKDIAPIVVSRTQLAKWVGEPYWKDVITGLYVRIGVGRRNKDSVYRLAEIQGERTVDKHYRLPGTGKSTNVELELKIANSRKFFKILYVSNSPLTDAEFNEFQLEMKRKNLENEIPSKSKIERRMKQVKKAENFVYTDDVINSMIKAHTSTPQPRNLVREKQSLELKLGVAMETNDEENIRIIRSKLAEIEKYDEEQRQRVRDKNRTLNKLNRRNRDINFAKLFQEPTQIRSSKPGELDPFARRSTKPQHWMARADQEDKDEKDEVEDEVEAIADSPVIRKVTNKFAAVKESISLNLSLEDANKAKSSSKVSLSLKPRVQTQPSNTAKKKLSLADYLKKKKGM